MSVEKYSITKNYLKSDEFLSSLDKMYLDGTLSSDEVKELDKLKEKYLVEKSFIEVEKTNKLIRLRKDIIENAVINHPQYKMLLYKFKKYTIEQMKKIQIDLGFTGKDVNGKFGINTFFAIKNKYGQHLDGNGSDDILLKELLAASSSKVPDKDSKVPDKDSKVPDKDSKVPDKDSKKIDYQSKLDGEEDFRDKYQPFVDNLSGMIGLPNGLITSIAYKESGFGANLNHSGGSKGVMQLTKWPFKSMRGDSGSKMGANTKLMDEYKEIFQKIDFEKLSSLRYSDNQTIRDTLSEDMWTKLKKLSSPNITNKEYVEVISEIFELIKSPKNKKKYFHTLNMIIGSVYLTYLYDKEKGSQDNKIKRATFNYNGNVAKASNGRTVRENYSAGVYSYYKKEAKKY